MFPELWLTWKEKEERNKKEREQKESLLKQGKKVIYDPFIGWIERKEKQAKAYFLFSIILFPICFSIVKW